MIWADLAQLMLCALSMGLLGCPGDGLDRLDARQRVEVERYACESRHNAKLIARCRADPDCQVVEKAATPLAIARDSEGEVQAIFYAGLIGVRAAEPVEHTEPEGNGAPLSQHWIRVAEDDRAVHWIPLHAQEPEERERDEAWWGEVFALEHAVAQDGARRLAERTWYARAPDRMPAWGEGVAVDARERNTLLGEPRPTGWESPYPVRSTDPYYEYCEAVPEGERWRETVKRWWVASAGAMG